ncbi:MAG TPA: hemolysin family protein [Roseiflexaceae bacterium]|nr:hemolysin family protein [Roseiflexaceae bacterium]
MALELALIIVLVVLNGVFSGSELALVSAKRGRLQPHADAGDPNAQAVLHLQDDPNRLLSTVQVGITLIGTLAGAFGGASLSARLAPLLVPIAGSYADSIALTLVVLAITYLSLVVGELVPKRLALQGAEAIAVRVARPMQLLARLSTPVIAILTFSTEAVLRLLGRHQVPEETVTEEDIRQLVREGLASGTVEAQEQGLIDRVFAFSDRTVRQIQTPRRQVDLLNAASPIGAALERALVSGYSRFPVYERHPDQVIGVVHVRDLVQATRTAPDAQLRTISRPALFVPESSRVSSLLANFRKTQQHLAVVIDEAGGLDGIVTLEDVLEELVGDIADEHDTLEPHPITRREDGSLLIDGSIPLNALERELGLNVAPMLEQQRVETLAGALLAQFGRLPQAGDSVAWEEWLFEVVDMDGLRIDKVLARLRHPPGNT